MSEDDDSGDLWCFHGCTIQVSRLPYVTGEGELEPAPLKCPGPGPVANPNTGAPASPSDAAGRSTDAPELNGSEGTQPRSEAGEGRAHSEETSRVGVGFSAPLGG